MKKTGFLNSLIFGIYVFFIFIFSCLAIEIAIRVLRPELVYLPKERERFCAYDKEIGWVNKPLVAGKLKAKDFEVEIQSNEMGRRGEDNYSYDKPEDIFRIAVLGDSFAWGYGVENHQTFAKKLENRLVKAQVLNFGCSGYGQDQELLLQKREVLRYRPDLTIINLHAASDFENNISFFQYGFYKPFFQVKEKSVTLENIPVPVNTKGTALNAWLSENSVAWRVLGNRKVDRVTVAARTVARADQKTDLIEKMKENLPPADLTCLLCREINRQASEAGGKTIFVLSTNLLLPFGQQGNRTPSEDAEYRQLRECLQAQGLEFLDLMPLFDQQLQNNPNARFTFDHDAHWNEAGHEFVASAILNYLSSRKGLKIKTEP